MKRLTILLTVVPFFGFSQAQNADKLRSQDLKKYEIKSAEIKYEISGDAEGQEMMTFDNYGWTSLRKQVMTFELYGITSTQTVYEITDGDLVYRLNPDDSTYLMKRDLKWSQQASYKNPSQVSEAILFSMGGTQQADSTLKGKSCQVWTFNGKAIQEMWIWKGLVMKRRAKLGDRNIVTVATEVNLDVAPGPAIFEIPDYFRIKE
ncbi:hypothetical protein [Ekhidna sp.]|uniref:hypothetical protein n=1 Tax=Ekhidna sp. TaxID=2608089 RepID=UPI0032995949